MKFSSDNHADISKYFNNCFIKIKESGDLLFFVQHVSRTEVRGVCETGAEFAIYLDNENPYEIDYVLPHKSYFQFGKDACQLYRTPAKQYYRGLNQQNTNVAKLNKEGTGQEGMKLSFDILKAFVSKQPFFSLSEATGKGKGIEGTNHSYVLTPRLAYHRLSKGLYVDGIRIASVDVPSKTIQFKHPIFKPEVAAFLAQSGETSTFTLV
jgi:hypothetical protein